ncbi:coiled-coil domain-containing protein 113-like [Tribolium madens]|uniref:coiled-coil domain-containing protein 113-like n=1 Tax=Tribolium madens TaxID=41895 RepID=UPI001CF7260C|nr:coiled-coil domain-containing protein 113-like [Tribolium madens]
MFGRRSQRSEQLLTRSKHALEDLDPPAIIRAMKDLQRKVQHLKIENEVFYKFLQENDSEAVKEMAELQEKRRINADRLQAVAERRRASSRGSVVSITNLGFGVSGPRGSIASLPGRPRGSVASISGRPRASVGSFSHFDSDLYSDKEAPKIILAQKLDMVMKCMEEFEKHLETIRNHSRKVKRTLLSNIEEMEIRNEEIRESIEHFEELKNSGPVTLEKFVRFFDEWMKKSRLTGDKIRLRHSSLKVQYHKAATLLANKKLIGEHVQEVDFDQLRVENLHLIEHIESKNFLLMEMKRMTADGNLKLTQLKKFLQEKVAKKETLVQSIKTFEIDIMKSDDELEKLYRELDQVKRKYDQSKERSEHYSAPDVLEYIRMKADVDNAKKELKVWERRKMIKELALSIAVADMKRIFRCTRTHPSWFK